MDKAVMSNGNFILLLGSVVMVFFLLGVGICAGKIHRKKRSHNVEAKSRRSCEQAERMEHDRKVNGSKDDEQTICPYEAIAADEEETINPYGATAADDERTINPYGAMAADDERTINPYGAVAADDERTINPYGAMAADDERTINPYGAVAADDEETVNPYDTGLAANVTEIDEEATINPYALDWMPRLTVGFSVEESEGKKRSTSINFSGSMWIGNGQNCELQVEMHNDPLYCVELTSGGGNLYVRNISPTHETVLLDGERLENELVPLRKGAQIWIGDTRITVEHIQRTEAVVQRPGMAEN